MIKFQNKNIKGIKYKGQPIKKVMYKGHQVYLLMIGVLFKVANPVLKDLEVKRTVGDLPSLGEKIIDSAPNIELILHKTKWDVDEFDTGVSSYIAAAETDYNIVSIAAYSEEINPEFKQLFEQKGYSVSSMMMVQPRNEQVVTGGIVVWKFGQTGGEQFFNPDEWVIEVINNDIDAEKSLIVTAAQQDGMIGVQINQSEYSIYSEKIYGIKVKNKATNESIGIGYIYMTRMTPEQIKEAYKKDLFVDPNFWNKQKYDGIIRPTNEYFNWREDMTAKEYFANSPYAQFSESTSNITYKWVNIDKTTGQFKQMNGQTSVQLIYNIDNTWLTSDDPNATFTGLNTDKVPNAVLKRKVIRLNDGNKYAIWGIEVADIQEFRAMITYDIMKYCRIHNLTLPLPIGYLTIFSNTAFRIFPSVNGTNPNIYSAGLTGNYQQLSGGMENDTYKIISSTPNLTISPKAGGKEPFSQYSNVGTIKVDCYVTYVDNNSNKLMAQVPFGANGAIPDTFDANKAADLTTDKDTLDMLIGGTGTVTVNCNLGYNYSIESDTIANATHVNNVITVNGLIKGTTKLIIKSNKDWEHQLENIKEVTINVMEQTVLDVPQGDITVKEGQSVTFTIESDAELNGIELNIDNPTVAKGSING